ncbi:MAG TPA: 6-phosphogluconolactonase [Candidatus Caenarcaniphilales bacterium]|jgi:6-phosphogluconolactonase
MTPTIEVLPDLASLIERSLEITLVEIHDALSQRGQCTLALAGGSTPKPLYEALATQNLPWEKLHIFWGDERYVPPDHPDSNQRMARLAWLDRVPIPASNVHPMPTDEADPAVAAQHYEQHLQTFFKVESGFPTLDLIFLGIGNDGHTASLFPHTEALQVCDRAVTVGNKDGQPRLTFTVPLINQARCVVFMVAGESKQAALGQIFAPEANELDYPARFVQPAGKLFWFLDAAAGQGFNP